MFKLGDRVKLITDEYDTEYYNMPAGTEGVIVPAWGGGAWNPNNNLVDAGGDYWIETANEDFKYLCVREDWITLVEDNEHENIT